MFAHIYRHIMPPWKETPRLLRYFSSNLVLTSPPLTLTSGNFQRKAESTDCCLLLPCCFKKQFEPRVQEGTGLQTHYTSRRCCCTAEAPRTWLNARRLSRGLSGKGVKSRCDNIVLISHVIRFTATSVENKQWVFRFQSVRLMRRLRKMSRWCCLWLSLCPPGKVMFFWETARDFSSLSSPEAIEMIHRTHSGELKYLERTTWKVKSVTDLQYNL